MTAENAVGLFVLAALVVSGGACLLVARAWDLWPFPPPPEEGIPEHYTQRLKLPDTRPKPPAFCGLVCEGGSERRGCDCRGPAQCPYRALVDLRHGDDGNSGHG